MSALLSGCGVEAPLSSASVSQSQPPSSSSAEPTSTPAIVAESVDIGDGRSLYLVCRGEGSPTVLFEAGDAWADDTAGAPDLGSRRARDRPGHARLRIRPGGGRTK